MTTANRPLRVLVWGENVHEQVEPHVRELYPDGMHGAIAAGIAENLGDARDRVHHHAGRTRARV